MRERALVFDPVCALRYGHNVGSLRYFSDALRSKFRSVIPVASIHLPGDIAAAYGFERDFDFYYHRHITLPLNTGQIRPHVHLGRRTWDPTFDLALRDIADIFAKYSLTQEDAIIFPSVDYYAALSLLDFLLQNPPRHAPSVYLDS